MPTTASPHPKSPHPDPPPPTMRGKEIRSLCGFLLKEVRSAPEPRFSERGMRFARPKKSTTGKIRIFVQTEPTEGSKISFPRIVGGGRLGWGLIRARSGERGTVSSASHFIFQSRPSTHQRSGDAHIIDSLEGRRHPPPDDGSGNHRYEKPRPVLTVLGGAFFGW